MRDPRQHEMALRGGIKTVKAVEDLMATVSRYENGLKVPVIDVPVLDEQDVDQISR